MSNMDDKRIILFEKVLDKFDQSKDKNMYECISNVLCTTLNNKNFFNIFMKKPELFKKIFSIIKNIRDEKKLIALLKLLIIINDNILQHFETHYTTNLAQENNKPVEQRQKVDTGRFKQIFCSTSFPKYESNLVNNYK